MLCTVYCVYILCIHSECSIFNIDFHSGTAFIGNDGAGAVECDSRRAVGPTKTIRGVLVYMTQLNRL